MIIRPYQTADCEALARLFYDTVHTVNAKDYTKAQLDVWATGNVDLEAWDLCPLRPAGVVCFRSHNHPRLHHRQTLF